MVAKKFSEGLGMIWRLQSKYGNPFKFITGVDMDGISCYSNEEEILLMNQFLPIQDTQTFEDDVEQNVIHLIFSLKTFQKPITNKKSFYNIIGLKYEKKWDELLKKNKDLLYELTSIRSCTVLERLHRELEITIFPDEYDLLSSKFEVRVFSAFSYYSIRNRNQIGEQTNCRYVQNGVENKYAEIEHDTTTIHQVSNVAMERLSLEMRNKEVFGNEKFIRMQEISVSRFESCTNNFHSTLKINHKGIIYLDKPGSIDADFLSEIFESKYILVLGGDNNKFAKRIEADDHELDEDQKLFDGHFIYQFDKIKNLHFVIPYTTKSQKIAVYVQFRKNYPFILFKEFDYETQLKLNIISNEDNELIERLLDAVKFEASKIENAKEFYESLELELNPNWLSVIKKHPALYQETEYENKIVLQRLYEELGIKELSQQYRVFASKLRDDSTKANDEVDEKVEDNAEEQEAAEQQVEFLFDTLTILTRRQYTITNIDEFWTKINIVKSDLHIKIMDGHERLDKKITADKSILSVLRNDLKIDDVSPVLNIETLTRKPEEIKRVLRKYSKVSHAIRALAQQIEMPKKFIYQLTKVNISQDMDIMDDFKEVEEEWNREDNNMGDYREIKDAQLLVPEMTDNSLSVQNSSQPAPSPGPPSLFSPTQQETVFQLREEITRLKSLDNEEDELEFKPEPMSWLLICNAVSHEMCPELATDIEKFIFNSANKLQQNNFDQSIINKLFSHLISITSFEAARKKYLQNLIERAKDFDPKTRMFVFVALFACMND